MQFSAFRGFRRVQRFKKLNRRRHDHRRIPIFAGQPLAVSLGRFFLIIIWNFDLTVVLQHVFFTQHLVKNVSVLKDDAGIRNHVNHALQAMLHRVRQGERQRRDCLAAARRHGQRVQPLLVLPAAQAARQNRAPLGAKVVGGRFQPRRDMGAQLFQKAFRRFPFAARLSALNRRLRIQIVRVHQTRKQHAGVHRQAPRVFLSRQPRRKPGFCRNFDFCFPRGRIVSARQALVQPSTKRSAAVVRLVAHVRQAAVMARHGKRRDAISHLPRHLRARRSVIHLGRMRRVALPLLPVGAVFADVVPQPRPMAVLLRAKCRRKFSRQRRDVLLVLPQRLIRSVRL